MSTVGKALVTWEQFLDCPIPPPPARKSFGLSTLTRARFRFTTQTSKSVSTFSADSFPLPRFQDNRCSSPLSLNKREPFLQRRKNGY